MSHSIRSGFARGIALVQIALLLFAGCSGGPLTPTPGSSEHQAPGMIPVPGGVVNAAGGNLLVARSDLTLDGIVGGAQAVGAVYNSSLPGWTWSFAVHYDGASYTDETGRTFDTASLPDGAAIPGSHWVKVDADTVQSKGGLARDFDALGRLAAVHWATLEHPRIRYTWSAGSLELSQCSAATACAAMLAIAFDAGGRPLAASDLRSQRRAEFTWNGSGRLVVAKSPLEVAKGWPGTRYEYTSSGLLSAITNSEGDRIEYAYQSGGRIFRVMQRGEGDPSHRFEFHSADRDGLYRTLYTNPLGARVRLVFDANTRLVSREWVETGERRTLTWSGLRPTSVTLESGAIVTYDHSGDELVAIHEPGGNVVQISYQAGGLNLEEPRARAVRRIQDGLGLVEKRSYDTLGRVILLTNGAGELTALDYNPASLLGSVTPPDGGTLTFPLYGAHGHWLEMTGAIGDKRSFDATGNPRVESAKGRRGGLLDQYFDENRKLVALGVAASDASGVTGSGTIAIERRSDGQPLAVRRPYGGDHEFSYDALGRAVEQRERVDGAWQTTRFERDPAGNVTARTRPNGMREEWQYDGYGRIVRHRALRDGSLEGEASYAYANGLLASHHDSIRGTSELYAYDAAGRLALTTYGYGETRHLEYDLRSRVSAEVLSAAGQVLFDVGYEYDSANRLIRTRDRAAQQTLVEHVIEGGRVVTTRHGNGLARSYAYDASGSIVGSETRNAANAVVESSRIERTGEANPLRLQVRTATVTPLAATEEQYWLDAGEKLSDPGKRVFGYSDGVGEPRTFAYDELSNQVSVPGGTAYTYNSERNRLLAAGVLTYGYDAAGYTTSRGGVPIAWTATGRIASFGGASAVWDLSGRLVALSFEGVSRRFDLFGGRVESDAGSGQVGALDLGDVSLEPLSGARSYRHFDFRSNVSFVTNDAGVVTQHYRYGPYGVDHAFGSGDNRHTFVGKPEAGPLMLLGARVYDPTVARFLSPDPLFTWSNQYTYTSGNPIGFMDVSGYLEITVGDVAATFKLIAAVAAVVGVAVVASPAVAGIVIVGIPLGNLAVATGAVAGLGAAYFSNVSAVMGADALFVGFPENSGGGSDAGSGGSPGGTGGSGGGGGGGGGGGAGPQKKLEFSIPGLTQVAVAPAQPATCSPSTLGRFGALERLSPMILIFNLLLGVVWWLNRRRSRPAGAPTRRYDIESV